MEFRIVNNKIYSTREKFKINTLKSIHSQIHVRSVKNRQQSKLHIRVNLLQYVHGKRTTSFEMNPLWFDSKHFTEII